MKKELEKKLAEEFPFMHRDKGREEQVANLYEAFGCEVGDGWYNLLRNLCKEIETVYAKHGQSVDIIVDQVKQKWGKLRFYYHFEGQPQRIQAFDFPNGSIRFSQGDTPLQNEIASIVHVWEEKSETICERCGEPGLMREGRTATLCDACWALYTDDYMHMRTEMWDRRKNESESTDDL